jgi:ABC-type lipoprotein export system ATPase subunit
LVGRERELRVLDDLVDGVGDQGGALVVCGESGIGKSALLAMANRRDRSPDAGLDPTGVQPEFRSL